MVRGMTIRDAERSANIAQGQAIEAVNVVQRKGITTDEDRYKENLALAVANLSIAVSQIAKHLK